MLCNVQQSHTDMCFRSERVPLEYTPCNFNFCEGGEEITIEDGSVEIADVSYDGIAHAAKIIKVAGMSKQNTRIMACQSMIPFWKFDRSLALAMRANSF